MRVSLSICVVVATMARVYGASSSGSETCELGDAVSMTVSGSNAIVTDAKCKSTTIAVTNEAKTNRTIVAKGMAIEDVISIPDADTLDLEENSVEYIADLSAFAQLKRLSLKKNQLKSLKSINLPASLLELDLSENTLPAFDDLGDLTLTTLDLTNLSIEDLTKVTMPSTLSSLSVRFNKLTKVPTTNAHNSLKKLWVASNQIKSFRDISIPPSLEYLDVSWNQLSSFDGFSLPSSVTQLFLGGNKFTSIAALKTTNALTSLYLHDLSLGNLDGVAFPNSVTALSLMNCNLTTLSNVTIPPGVLYLDISKNLLTSIPSSYPDTMRSLQASENQLTSLSNIKFPTSTKKLEFTSNAITKIAGVAFPLLLEELLLGDNPISEFEIQRSDLITFQKLTKLNATVLQSGCSNAAAQAVKVGTTQLCVIPDDVFAKQYNGGQSVEKPAEPKSGGGGWVLPVVIGAAVVAVIGVAVFIVRRRRRQNSIQKPPPATSDYAHTLANPSVFGDLPTFEQDRGKHHHLQQHQQQHVTMGGANMNTYSTMFSNSNSSGSGGAESSLIKYRIPTHEITLKRSIAHGGFGAVYLAMYQMQDVVVKKILPEKASDDRCLQAFLDEIKLCSTLNHPKIVRFIGVSWNTLSDIAVVLEYMACGDLDTLLKQQNVRNRTHPGEFDWYESATLPCKSAIALDILDAVVYLHSFSSPIIHRDLKAKNVLLSHSYEAKLSDFGVSKEWKVDATMTAGIGTMAWIAPEVLRGERYTEKADMYSFGVVLTELATCAKPFEGITNALIVLKVTSGEQRPEMGPNCPSDIRELGLRCLSYDPGDRPSAMVAHYELKTLLKAHTRFEL